MFFIPPHAYKLLGDLAKALVKINGFTRGGGGSHVVPDEVRGARWGQMRSVEVVWGRHVVPDEVRGARWGPMRSAEVVWEELRGGEVVPSGPPSSSSPYTKGGHGNLRGGFSSPAGLLGPPFFKSEAT